MLATAQGSTWNWQSPLHQSLRGELQAVVARLHEAGVVHGDLNVHNIKVTPDNRVYILDFEKAVLPSTSPEYAAEMTHEQTWLDYIVSTKVGKHMAFHFLCLGCLEHIHHLMTLHNSMFHVAWLLLIWLMPCSNKCCCTYVKQA